MEFMYSLGWLKNIPMSNRKATRLSGFSVEHKGEMSNQIWSHFEQILT